MRKTTKAPAPSINTDEGTEALEGVASVNVVSLDIKPGKGKRSSLFDTIAVEENARLAEKTKLSTTARQQLAEAFDLFKEGANRADEAKSVASKASVALYQGRTTGLLSAEEVSSILGDQFGYKVKGTAQAGASPTTGGVPSDYSKNGQTASKTPYGDGEQIRKRVVRLAAAYSFVHDGDGGTFFEGLDPDEVSGLLDSVESGDTSMYRAFDILTEMRKEANGDQTPAAFRVKTITTIADKLSEASAPALMIDTPGLAAAYAALRQIIDIVDAEAAKLLIERQAA
jgi:hypothetical protein